MQWEVSLSTVVLFVSGIGVLIAYAFADSVGPNIWLASRLFLLFGVVLVIAKR